MSLAVKAARASSQGGMVGNVQAGGFLGDVFGGIGRAVTGGVGALLSGGNPITGAISGAFRGGGSGPKAPKLPAFPGTGGLPALVPGPGAGLPAPRSGTSITSPAGVEHACPKGTHPNKTGYFLKDGSYIAPGSRCVKNRRRNPGNMRALSNAMQRLDGGKRLQHKLTGYSTPKYTSGGKKKSCR